jgi:hypothetical protein
VGILPADLQGCDLVCCQFEEVVQFHGAARTLAGQT